MEPQTETQEKVIVEQVPDRQLDREKAVDERFEKIEAKLDKQPTLEDFEKMSEDMREFMARINNYIHTFTIGVDILSKSSKWIVYSVITIGGIAGGFLVIKNGLVGILAWVGFTRVH